MSLIFIPLLNSWFLCWSTKQKYSFSSIPSFTHFISTYSFYSFYFNSLHPAYILQCLFILSFIANPILLQTGIKVYMSFRIIMVNWMMGFFLMNIRYIVDFYVIEVVNMRLNSLSWCMVLVIRLVSSCVILCSIDYLSVLDSSLFLNYISIFQFTMIIFVISNDLIITIMSWDWLGLISVSLSLV